MNLQPLQIADIPLGKPLPWRIYDHDGYIALARGAIVSNREQLEALQPRGLLRDLDAPEQAQETGDIADEASVATDSFPPAGIKPQIGERVQFRLLNRDLQIYYTARLIGYIHQRSVLLTTPLVNGNPLILADGEQIEVRMVTGNNIYAFRAPIQRVCVSPVHYLHLDYPAEVRMQSLRRSPWASVNLSATAAIAEQREVVRIINLSPGGAQLQTTTKLGATGTGLRLAFPAEMDGLKTTLDIEATVLHAPAGETGSDSYEYSIAFGNLSTADALWLKGLVYRYIAEGHPA